MSKLENKNEKKCKLCNKPYTYNYELFGRTCLNNLYKNFKIAIPKVLNKENYFCTRIAWRCHKFFLNKDKKYALVQNYIALDYLKKIKGIKNKLGIWNLEIELKDKYDFTDIIWFNGYANKDFTDNIPKALISSTLNNFASISSAYDVLKNYKFTIKMKVDSCRM